jgi:hypothetical protein
MKPETTRQLNHLIFMQRLKIAAMATGGGLALLALVLFVGYETDANMDKVVKTSHMRGTILQAKRANGRNGNYKLIVKLSNGQSIRTYSLIAAGIPYSGELIDLNEIVHKSGLKNYVVTRLIDNHR